MHVKGIYSSSNCSDAILKRNYCPRKSSCPSAMWQQESDVTRPIKEKSNINSLQSTASVGHPKYLLLFFSISIHLISWTLDFYQKRNKTKWNSYTWQYLACFNTDTQVPALNLPCICWKLISACPLIFCSRSFPCVMFARHTWWLLLHPSLENSPLSCCLPALTLNIHVWKPST